MDTRDQWAEILEQRRREREEIERRDELRRRQAAWRQRQQHDPK
jgi:hypothetical protein